MAKADLDIWIRARFSVSQGAKDRHEDAVLLREALAKGFEGQRVPLIAGQGIFKPADVPEMPFSVTTVPLVECGSRLYNNGVERSVVSRPPGLTARGRGGSVRLFYAPACSLGVGQRALLVG